MARQHAYPDYPDYPGVSSRVKDGRTIYRFRAKGMPQINLPGVPGDFDFRRRRPHQFCILRCRKCGYSMIAPDRPAPFWCSICGFFGKSRKDVKMRVRAIAEGDRPIVDQRTMNLRTGERASLEYATSIGLDVFAGMAALEQDFEADRADLAAGKGISDYAFPSRLGRAKPWKTPQ